MGCKLSIVTKMEILKSFMKGEGLNFTMYPFSNEAQRPAIGRMSAASE